MPLYRLICSACLISTLFAASWAEAQPLTIRSQPLPTLPANVTEFLDAATDKTNVRQLVIDRTLLNQSDWQQRLSQIKLQLDNDTSVIVLPKQRSLKADRLIWQGYIAGYPNSHVAMVISPKGISGSVRYNGKLWQIRRLANDQIIMFSTAKELLNANDIPNLTSTQAQQQVVIARQQNYQILLPTVKENANGFTEQTRLQVMVYYDIQELATYPDLLDLIDLEFQQANAALLNSGVDVQLNAVVKLPISRQNASRGMLSLMLSGEEMFRHLARDRQRYEADLVHYFGLNLDQFACGLAYLSAFPNSEAFPDLALGATNSSCLGSLVFAHEMGHNLGAKHDRHVEPDADSQYNYGYVDLETASRTIMAYFDLCDANGITCESLPYFSNPALAHQGRPIGIAELEPNAADNHKMLNFSALTLANYSGVGVPTGVIATNTNIGPVIISWQAFPGATSYELYRSGSCAYDSFKTLVVSTTETSFADTDAAGGRNCYFVQAINENLLNGAQRSGFSLPESGFGSGPALDKIADQRVDSIDQTIAVTFSSAAVVAPTIEIVQHDLPYEPQHTLQNLGNGQYQLSVRNLSHNDGTATVKVTTDRVFEVFSVTFSSNANTPPVIVAPQKVVFNQKSSTNFNVDIVDSQINLANPVGVLVQSEDSRLLPNSALDYALIYTENGAQLSIDITPQHKLFGNTALNIKITDGEHLVSQRVEVEIVRVLNQLPQVPASTIMYLDGNKPLQRLLPVYDADNDTLVFTLLIGPTKGQVTFNENAFVYQADADFTGEDSFSYRVTEQYSGESFDASVVISNKAKQYLLPKQKLINNIGTATTNLLLDYSGQLWAWGVNSWQLFSTNPALSVTQPTPAALYAAQWADISMSDSNALLIHQDGSLWQLGYDSLDDATNVNSPKRIGNANDWKTLVNHGDLNIYCQLLIKLDGSLWAMGTCSELETAGMLKQPLAAQYTPVQIGAQYHWVSGKHSQADTALIDNQGRVWTGAADNWAHYSGRETESAFLVLVSSLNSPATDVHPVVFRTFALTVQGLYGWGSFPTNAPWQWEDFDNENYAGAIALDTPDIKQLSSSGPFLLMLDNTNSLWTAGGLLNHDASNGALGRGHFAARGLAKVDFEDEWLQIFSTEDISYGLSNKGQLLVAGQYDLTRGTRTLNFSEQISLFTPIAQFSLSNLGYTDTDADGIPDYLETDADNDSMIDGWELLHGLDRQNAADAALDNDHDGLTNLQEYQLGINPNEADTDTDGMPDSWEIQHSFNPVDAADGAQDGDNDGLTNAQEYTRGTNPHNSDSDNDGMSDGWEVVYGLDPNNAADAALDNDNDSLTNLTEYQVGTNPNAADTDTDGMPDSWEIQHSFNPVDAADGAQDSDNDGLTNTQEYTRGTDPHNSDSDNDSMPDGWEVQYGLNPLESADAGSDLDNDGFTALQEYQNGTHPSVSNKVAPPSTPAPSSSGGIMPYWMLLLLSLAYGRQRNKIT